MFVSAGLFKVIDLATEGDCGVSITLTSKF